MESLVLFFSKIWGLKNITCKITFTKMYFSWLNVLPSLAQNGEMLNVNYEIESHLAELSVPLGLLRKVHLMQCLSKNTAECTMPGGIITDFNIWDRAFSEEELMHWTSCRYGLRQEYCTAGNPCTNKFQRSLMFL